MRIFLINRTTETSNKKQCRPPCAIAVHRSIFDLTQFDSPDLRPDPTRPADNKNKSSAVAGMGERLATIDMGRKWEGLLWGLGPHWVPI